MVSELELWSFHLSSLGILIEADWTKLPAKNIYCVYKEVIHCFEPQEPLHPRLWHLHYGTL
jgi:hypothetical protein